MESSEKRREEMDLAQRRGRRWRKFGMCFILFITSIGDVLHSKLLKGKSLNYVTEENYVWPIPGLSCRRVESTRFLPSCIGKLATLRNSTGFKEDNHLKQVRHDRRRKAAAMTERKRVKAVEDKGSDDGEKDRRKYQWRVGGGFCIK
ncbi:hypothetical protein YC2023_060829 [Brassica napus]